jgi:hypothetical protein
MRWLSRVLTRPRARLWILLIAVVWMLPSLTIGYVLDDKFHEVMMRGAAPFDGLARGPLALYELSGRGANLQLARQAGGSMPWYTAPTFEVNFLRPLSSLTLYLDHRWSPRSAVPGHLDSILWLVLLLIILDRIYRRLIPDAPWVAALALLLCAVDEGHAMSVGWIANRNAPVATCFAALALLLHLRGRSDGRRADAWWAALAFAAGLAAGEMALTGAAYLFAYAVFLDRAPTRERILSLVPYALVAVVWLVLYNGLGYGAHGSHYYIDPGDAPGRFVAAAARRLPLLVAAQLSPLPADLSTLLGPRALPGHLVAAIALVAVILAAAWPLIRAHAVARFALAGMLLSALPLCSAAASDRLLLPVSIGGALLIALSIAWVHKARRTGTAPLAARALGRFLVVSHLIVAPLLLPLRTLEFGLYDRAYVQAARSLDRVDDFTGRTLVIVNGPDFFFTWWAPVFRFVEDRSVPARLRVLGDAEGLLEIMRPDASTLRLHAASGFAGHTLGPIVTDPAHPIDVGFSYATDDLTVVVRALGRDGRPTEIDCRFATPLEDDGRVYVIWTKAGYRRFELPPIGSTVLPERVSRREALRYRDQ